MRIPSLLLFALLAAGCASPSAPPTSEPSPTPGDAGQEADFITPGVWDVRGDTDYMMAWVHNLAAARALVTWTLTGPAGAALPDGWTATFSEATADLQANGAKTTSGQGYAYPDWARTEVTLRIPATEGAGNHTVELHVGNAVRTAVATVHAARGRVAGPGSHVFVSTVGTIAEDGHEFWRGDFDTVLGQPGAVDGVSYGLMGVTAGETVALRTPPAFAYGYDNPAPKPGQQDYSQFNGHTLVFTMRMTRFS
ncbi:MAG: FKBP-type peptidyl-prolyl cis-trans isomerase [Thermoplasmatota archaeon]